MTDDSESQTEVLLRRALAPIIQDTLDVPETIVQRAVRQGRRRRQLRRAGVALVPLVAAAAVAATMVSIHFSTGSPDNPPTDKFRTLVWQKAAQSPLSPRSNPAMVQVGHDVVVIGGTITACGPTAFCAYNQRDALSDGAVYDPDRDVWRKISSAPVALENVSATASGSAVYLLNQPMGSSGQAQQFWEYALTTNRWTRLPAPPQRMDVLKTTGTDRLIAYVTAHAKTWTADQSYDIASRTWSPIPRDPLGPSEDRNLIPTDSGNLVLMAVDRRKRPAQALWTPWRTAQWNARTQTWKEIPTPAIVASGPTWRWTAGQIVNPSTQAVEQGRRLVQTGGIFDPANGTWQPVPLPPTQTGTPTYPTLETSGAGRIFVHEQMLDVSSRTWIKAPQFPPRFPTQDAAATIIDDRMIVFGGAIFNDSLRGTLTNSTWVLPLPSTGS